MEETKITENGTECDIPVEEHEHCTEERNGPCKGKSRSKDKQLIEELQGELDKQKELLMRTAAEFDNFKRRTEKERSEVYERAAASVLKNLLQVIDNAERAAAADRESEEYAKGIEMIAKQLSDLSTKLGLVAIGEKGEKFDPNFHDAIMHIEDPELPESTVSAVMQKGYKYGNTVIRPAMVQVAN